MEIFLKDCLRVRTVSRLCLWFPICIAGVNFFVCWFGCTDCRWAGIVGGWWECADDDEFVVVVDCARFIFFSA